jgi:gamma-glutamylputrescine oxidase
MPELSIWEKESFYADQDIIIIGSGFGGLWSALHLKLLNPNCKITILERGLIPTGASTRNAGFSCFGSPSELIADAKEMGEDNMWQLVSMRYKGLMEIRKFFRDEEIDYDLCGGYECYTTNSENWKECSSKLNWLNDGLKVITGQENVFTIANEKLSEFGFTGFGHMISNKLEGALHSGKLVQALLRKVQSVGVQVLTGMQVLAYSEQQHGVEITTNQVAMCSRSLLLCTNAFTSDLVSPIDIIPNRGQVLLTAPIKELRFKGTFHFDRGYYYFRNLGDRLLIGGARNMGLIEENTQVMETTPLIQAELEKFIKQYLLPGTDFTITDRWSGIMAMGKEKLPIVKALSEKVFCCVRMSGMGVALAPTVAEQVAKLMSQPIRFIKA